MADMTREQKEWLLANRREFNGRVFDEWIYTSNARPIIDELVNQGCLKATDKFVSAPQKHPPETINLFGKAIPIETMMSIYALSRGTEL